MVIDCGHDTTVAPMEMFMYQAWKDKPEYDINTQYCSFACNLYFELYKSKIEENKYYVFYYIDDELKNFLYIFYILYKYYLKLFNNDINIIY